MKTLRLAGLAVLILVAAGCGSTSKKGSAPTSGCKTDQLPLVNKGQLTVATDNPAYPPWFEGSPPKGSTWKFDDPNTGKGFESAVVYSVAGKLGFARSAVKWIVVPFDQSYKPGPKSFDFDINEVSVTPARAKSVAFSNSYYDVNQALVALKGTPLTSAKTQADVARYKLGVQLGTTSYDYVVKNIKPSKKPSVYSNSNDVNSGLKTKGIDGIVVDLPTAVFTATSGEVPNSVVVGKFPPVGHFGLVFEKGNGLAPCVNKALATMQSTGALTRLQHKWLSAYERVPVLK